MKMFSPLTLLLAAFACSPAWATSQGTANTTTPIPKKTAEKAAEKPGARTQAKANGKKKDEEKKMDVAGMQAMPYDCELGNKLTIYRKPDDDQQIALQWQKRTHSMTRMQTASGAERFENTDQGLVWIGIPAKGMLLDSKKGRQLANECRNEEQKNLVKK